MTDPVAATEPTPLMVGCRDGCGKQVTESEAMRTNWRWLPISKRWRCPDCGRALDAADKIGVLE